MTPIIPDLSAFEVGGITLVLACWLVLQAVKKQAPWISTRLPLIVIALAGALTGAFMFAPLVFSWLAGTLATSALILGGHALIKQMAQKPPGK